MEDAGPLVAVNGAEFGIANRQVAIAAEMGLIDHDMERTVHWFQLILAGLNLHGSEHIVAVIVDVTASLPEVEAGHVRGIDEVVPMLKMLLTPKVFNEQ